MLNAHFEPSHASPGQRGAGVSPEGSPHINPRCRQDAGTALAALEVALSWADPSDELFSSPLSVCTVGMGEITQSWKGP